MIFINFSLVLYADEKQSIINRLVNIDNITFDFEQITNEKKEVGKCILVFDNKLNCDYEDSAQKRILTNGKTLIIQQKRYDNYEGVYCNAQISTKQMNKYCILEEKGELILKNAIEKLNLSARSYARIKKVSRTIADLENSRDIQTVHVAEAIQYRSLDREAWAG